MTKNEKPRDFYIWTGEFPVEMDEPGRVACVVSEVSPLSGMGVVRLSFDRATCPPDEHETFLISEGTARRLIEQLTRVVNRAEAIRGLYQGEEIRAEALTHRDDLPWQPPSGSSDRSRGDGTPA
jgi:hypothetical protein